MDVNIEILDVSILIYLCLLDFHDDPNNPLTYVVIFKNPNYVTLFLTNMKFKMMCGGLWNRQKYVLGLTNKVKQCHNCFSCNGDNPSLKKKKKGKTKIIHKVTLSFTPYPQFQWYPQSEEILLNAQGLGVITIVV